MRYLAVSVLIHSFFFLLLGQRTELPKSSVSRTQAIHLTSIGDRATLRRISSAKTARSFPVLAQDDRFDWPLHMPSPSYPLLAKEKGWEGKVIFELKTDQAGYIESLRILAGSGYQLLDEEAYKAVKEWRLAPQLLAQIPVVFRLK